MFAEVLIPQKVGTGKETLTYAIPEGLSLEVGQIVEVPLRNSKVKGVVFSKNTETPAYKTKDVIGLVANAPHLERWQLPILSWIADYYFAPLFKTLKLFLPVPFIKKKKLVAAMPEDLSPYEFNPQHNLNDDQKKVLKIYKESKKTVSLLHGITGSGKTEIYLHVADEKLKEGKQVLMLIPEISLTTQTVDRFTDHFKQKIAVIHSQLTAKQKENAWMSIHKGEARIVIGSRSALFAPFPDLGVIIMDEEHDSSYKQDQAPRYNTLDVAEKIAESLKIKILLGSATPSLETFYKAENRDYELLMLHQRANSNNGSALPKTHIVDLREEIKKKNFSIFSEKLHALLMKKLESKEQAILFLNRRGAASAVICRECGYVAKCPKCDVPMTYHNRYSVENSVFHAERLICHHCGLIEKVPYICPTCQSHYIRYIGLGTQRVEDELIKAFPQAKILRADSDTTKKRESFKHIYEDFKSHKADVLIGTQMIALGLHLPNVNLVGVILADLGLTIPNFRSGEKTFQLITQVAGRAGRESENGEVVIQTYLPHHYVITRAAAHDYHGFYRDEIKIRKNLGYPPFSKLIKLTFSDASNKKATDAAMLTFQELEIADKKTDSSTSAHLITCYPSLIPKFKNRYRWHVLISGPKPRELLKKCLPPEGTIIDVDPLSTV